MIDSSTIASGIEASFTCCCSAEIGSPGKSLAGKSSLEPSSAASMIGITAAEDSNSVLSTMAPSVSPSFSTNNPSSTEISWSKSSRVCAVAISGVEMLSLQSAAISASSVAVIGLVLGSSNSSFVLPPV